MFIFIFPRVRSRAVYSYVQVYCVIVLVHLFTVSLLSSFVIMNYLTCVLCIANPCCCSCNAQSHHKSCVMCCSNSVVPTDSSMIQQPPPLRPFGRTWNQLGCHTCPDNARYIVDADSAWNFQVMGYPCHRQRYHHHHHHQQMPAISHLGVSDCRGFRHVTSSLPVIIGPTAHAPLSDRDQFFVNDFRNLPYQQADMRDDIVVFPVPVEGSYNQGCQFGDIWMSDNAKQFECNEDMTKKRYSLETTMKTQVNRFLLLLISIDHSSAVCGT